MRRGLLVAVLALAALPGAAAQDLTSLDLVVDAPAPARPGTTVETPGRVEYCYRTTGLAPATIALRAGSDAAWAAPAVEPSSFQATTAAGQTCGSRDITVAVLLGRDAPAFTPGPVHLEASTGGTSPRSKTTAVPVQALYWAEVDVSQAERPRITRGEDARLTVVASVGANGGTRMEVTGGTPDGKLTVQGQVLSSLAVGHGLDQIERRSITLNVASSPGASLGVQKVPLKFTTLYALSPSEVGEEHVFQAEVHVVEPKGMPGPGLGVLAFAVAGAAVLAARRR